jgi:regulator of nonsense transcripts 2
MSHGNSEFTLKLLTSPWRIHFDQLACLASLVSALGDHHDWISIRVLDDVLEFIRLSLELNLPSWQQQAQSTIIYFGQLFNYNVSNTATLFKVKFH